MLSIAGRTFSSPFALAPLAGYTDLPFRLLCREHGAGFCVSEMISCHALCYRQQKTLDMLVSAETERPVSFQLFGAEPDLMGEAAAILADFSPDMIDINMGCPVKKVTRRGAGAALMQTPELAEQIIVKVCRSTTLPVTVKIRSGPDRTAINAVEFSRMAEAAGVSAIAIHGRTWSQGFSGSVDRQIIAEVKKAVSLPVIANGDIYSYADGLAMMREIGCDGVMIGRAALGNPWIFTAGQAPDLAEILAVALRHLELIEQYSQPEKTVGSIKNHLGRYFKGLPGSSHLRQQIYSSPSFSDLKIRLTNLARSSSPTVTEF
jgi:tRNA-dihydrouridine synthase B